MYRHFFKRVLDLFTALLLTSFFLPIALILMVIIRFESKGSPIYIQKRTGKDAKEFKIYKLRSMRKTSQKNEGSFRTAKNDVRITKFGSFIRKTSLDEIPQIINVLKGDMSLIGPRPDVLDMKSLYSQEEWLNRTSIRPGVTGLAQVTIRSSGTQEQRTQLDLLYIKNISFLSDLKIIFLTACKVLRRSGVN